MIILTLVYLGLPIAALINPFWGLCGILSWNLLADKNGAHLHATLFGVPLYVTELTIAAMVVSLAVRFFRKRGGWAQTMPSNALLWSAFYGNSLLSVARGATAYGAVRVFRDWALVYYSIFTHLTVVILDSKPRLKRFALILGLVVMMKIFLSALNNVFRLDWVFFQPAAVSLAFGCFLAAAWVLMPRWRNPQWVWASAFVVAFAEFILWRVRSTWIAFAVLLLFLVASAIFMRLSYKQVLKGAGLSLLGVVFYLTAPLFAAQGVANPRSMIVRLGEIRPFVDFKNTFSPQYVGKFRDAWNIGSLRGLSQGEVPSKGLPDTKISVAPPVPVNSGVLAKPVVPEDRGKEAVEELTSILDGLKSSNVLTRLFFWTDVVEEVFQVHLPVFEGHWEDKRQMTPLVRGVLEKKMGPIIMDHEVRAGIPYWLVNNHVLRALNGVPFGKNFIPSRVYSWLWETNRYDPHNSHLAVMYRTGVAGFFLYLALVFFYVLRAVAFARKTLEEEARLAMLATLGCFAVHFIHTVTDVTLENSYKGAFFWVLLGLMEVVRNLWPLPAASATALSPGEAVGIKSR